VTFWEFQSLGPDKSCRECPMPFLDLIPAPQLNRRSEQSASYAFYHCRAGLQPTAVWSVLISNLVADNGNQFLFENSLINSPHHNFFLDTKLDIFFASIWKQHFFKIRFLHLWFIHYLSQILHIPSKWTKNAGHYINGIFSLTQLLTMF